MTTEVPREVLVEHDGAWLPGTVVWEYVEQGRDRAMVRYRPGSSSPRTVLRWSDELRPAGSSEEPPGAVVVLPQQRGLTLRLVLVPAVRASVVLALPAE